MPPPMSAKCRGSTVRQLSLQNQISVQSSGNLKLKKQYSEDDSRLLDAVEVTGQGWLPSERSDSVLRIGFGEGKIMQSKINGSKLKPAKVAWTEKRQDSGECRADVEVIAIKCQSQPRPLSVKAQRFRNPLLGNKDTLMYTRMQLAERLRNAWSEREKIKPNLNIFLAHASNTTRSDSASIDGNQENASTLSDPLEKKKKPLQMRAFSQDYCPPELFQDKLKVPPFGLKLQGNYFKQENDDVPSLSESIDSTANDENKSTEETHCLQEFNKIEIRVTKNEDTHSSNFCLHKENMEANHACEPNGDNQSEKTVKTVMTAEVRRAKFRSSSILNKTITESFSSSLTNEEEKFCEENDDVKKSNSKKVLIRALSAPSHDQHYQKENFPQKAVKFQPPIAKRLQGAVASDASGRADDVNTMRERIKSAPIRRKLKTAARRKNKDKGESSSEEEKETKEPTTKSKKATRRTVLKNGNDIVTMVSLVSPAETDTEDSVINLPMESLARVEKKEITVQSNPTREQGVKGTSFVIQKFVSLRKPSKTVTFQNPVLNRNYSASFPSRRVPAGTPIIIPSPVINNPALTPAQLQERDKRPPIYAGMDGRGIKRRLVRSPSEPVKEEDAYESNRKPCATLGEDFPQFSDETSEKEKIGENLENGEPQFKCPKEKECWTLYKKMVAKGVSVTFDTVLRGMLTPTEYRLKKNRLLSTD